MRVILITGASRGIGLGLVKELVKVPSCTILATCRDPSKATELRQTLKSASQPDALPLDVTDDQSIADFAKTLQVNGYAVNELINNAGISVPNHPVEDLGNFVRADMMNVFNTNVAGVAAVTLASGVLNQDHGKVVNITSSLGSLASATNTGSVSYRCSKAALNMLTLYFTHNYPNTHFTMVHPGWVQTDMGGAGNRTADICIEESAKGIAKLLCELDEHKSGRFVDWRGNTLDW